MSEMCDFARVVALLVLRVSGNLSEHYPQVLGVIQRVTKRADTLESYRP